jgi:D-alanyl-D-alanine carboxypeptidase
MRKLTLSAALIISSAVSLATGQGQLPNTPAAREFSAWLAACKSADRIALQHFLDNYPSHPGGVEGQLEFCERTGGFDFRKAEESTATRFTGLVQERKSDQFARFEIEVEAAAPNHVIKFGPEAIPRPPEFPIVRLSEPDALEALAAKLQADSALGEFSGAVMVAKDGKPVFSKAYRYADMPNKVPNKLDTEFRIGSMNKMFTAVSILQLVQAGKVQLNDPLIKFLPDYPNKELATKVTIHHLLTHTGGTGDFFGPEFDAHRLELRTLQDYVTPFGKRGVAFEPGSKWDYSNYGFLLLGLVVEKASGQNYYDYVRDHVYQPAGMTRTASLPEDQAVPDRSVGYMRGDDGKWQPNTNTMPYRGTSAGGGYSTVGDLVNFANAVINHKLLNAQYTAMLTTGKVAARGPDKYAYGFMDRTVDGVRSFGHGGGAPGMNGDLTIYPQSGYVVAVLANLDPPAAQREADFVGSRLPAR